MVNVFIKVAPSFCFIEMGIISKEPYLFMIARVKTPKVKLFFQMQTRLLFYISLFMFPLYVFMQSSLILNTLLGNKALFHV